LIVYIQFYKNARKEATVVNSMPTDTTITIIF